MGMVSYISRHTGTEVQADFPLHPSLVNATRADGSMQQFQRAAFDAEFQQQLPELPKVAMPRQPYEPPAVIKLEDLAHVPTSHHAWFAVISDKLDATAADLADIKQALAELVAALPPRAAEETTQPGTPVPPREG